MTTSAANQDHFIHMDWEWERVVYTYKKSGENNHSKPSWIVTDEEYLLCFEKCKWDPSLKNKIIKNAANTASSPSYFWLGGVLIQGLLTAIGHEGDLKSCSLNRPFSSYKSSNFPQSSYICSFIQSKFNNTPVSQRS